MFQTWVRTLVTLVVTLIVGISVLATQTEQTATVHAWVLGLSTAAFLLALLIVGIFILSARDRPRLEFGKSNVDLVGVHATRANGGMKLLISGANSPLDDDDIFQATGPTGPTGSPGPARVGQQFFATRLPVFNRPSAGNKSALAVHVHLRYFNASETTPIREVAAKWTFSSQGMLFESTQLATQVDIPANEMGYNFDVLAKFADDDQIYGVDDQSRFRGWKANPLGVGPIRVQVTVQGSNCKPMVRIFETCTMDSNDGVELIPIGE